jgi:single-strand DNA-binding protein
MNLNKAFVLGNITRDPELKTTPSGQSVCSFSVATNRSWTDKASGKKQEAVEFHNIVAWGKTGELVSTYMKKGSQILVEGRLQTRSWDDKKTGSKRYSTEIVAENIQFGAKPRSDQDERPAAAPQDGGEEISSEDLPF